jgi:Leucine Rich repeat
MKMVTQSSYFQSLCLAQNAFGDRGAHFIAEAIRNHPTLTRLDVSSTGLRDKGVTSLAHAVLASEICSLDLSTRVGHRSNQFGEQGAESLVYVLKQAGNPLQKLNLARTGFQSMVHFSKQLCDKSIHISTLDLSGNRLGDSQTIVSRVSVHDDMMDAGATVVGRLSGIATRTTVASHWPLDIFTAGWVTTENRASMTKFQIAANNHPLVLLCRGLATTKLRSLRLSENRISGEGCDCVSIKPGGLMLKMNILREMSDSDFINVVIAISLARLITESEELQHIDLSSNRLHEPFWELQRQYVSAALCAAKIRSAEAQSEAFSKHSRASMLLANSAALMMQFKGPTPFFNMGLRSLNISDNPIGTQGFEHLCDWMHHVACEHWENPESIGPLSIVSLSAERCDIEAHAGPYIWKLLAPVLYSNNPLATPKFPPFLPSDTGVGLASVDNRVNSDSDTPHVLASTTTPLSATANGPNNGVMSSDGAAKPVRRNSMLGDTGSLEKSQRGSGEGTNAVIHATDQARSNTDSPSLPSASVLLHRHHRENEERRKFEDAVKPQRWKADSKRPSIPHALAHRRYQEMMDEKHAHQACMPLVRLVHLNLNHNRLGDQGVWYATDALCRYATKNNLDTLPITVRGSIGHPYLRSLRLADNRITDIGGTLFCGLLKSSFTLEKLDLQNNELSEVFGAEVLELIAPTSASAPAFVQIESEHLGTGPAGSQLIHSSSSLLQHEQHDQQQDETALALKSDQLGVAVHRLESLKLARNRMAPQFAALITKALSQRKSRRERHMTQVQTQEVEQLSHVNSSLTKARREIWRLEQKLRVSKEALEIAQLDLESVSQLGELQMERSLCEKTSFSQQVREDMEPLEMELAKVNRDIYLQHRMFETQSKLLKEKTEHEKEMAAHMNREIVHRENELYWLNVEHRVDFEEETGFQAKLDEGIAQRNEANSELEAEKRQWGKIRSMILVDYRAALRFFLHTIVPISDPDFRKIRTISSKARQLNLSMFIQWYFRPDVYHEAHQGIDTKQIARAQKKLVQAKSTRTVRPPPRMPSYIKQRLLALRHRESTVSHLSTSDRFAHSRDGSICASSAMPSSSISRRSTMETDLPQLSSHKNSVFSCVTDYNGKISIATSPDTSPHISPAVSLADLTPIRQDHAEEQIKPAQKTDCEATPLPFAEIVQQVVQKTAESKQYDSVERCLSAAFASQNDPGTSEDMKLASHIARSIDPAVIDPAVINDTQHIVKPNAASVATDAVLTGTTGTTGTSDKHGTGSSSTESTTTDSKSTLSRTSLKQSTRRKIVHRTLSQKMFQLRMSVLAAEDRAAVYGGLKLPDHRNVMEMAADALPDDLQEGTILILLRNISAEHNLLVSAETKEATAQPRAPRFMSLMKPPQAEFRRLEDMISKLRHAAGTENLELIERNHRHMSMIRQLSLMITARGSSSMSDLRAAIAQHLKELGINLNASHIDGLYFRSQRMNARNPVTASADAKRDMALAAANSAVSIEMNRSLRNTLSGAFGLSKNKKTKPKKKTMSLRPLPPAAESERAVHSPRARKARLYSSSSTLSDSSADSYSSFNFDKSLRSYSKQPESTRRKSQRRQPRRGNLLSMRRQRKNSRFRKRTSNDGIGDTYNEDGDVIELPPLPSNFRPSLFRDSTASSNFVPHLRSSREGLELPKSPRQNTSIFGTGDTPHYRHGRLSTIESTRDDSGTDWGIDAISDISHSDTASRANSNFNFVSRHSSSQVLNLLGSDSDSGSIIDSDDGNTIGTGADDDSSDDDSMAGTPPVVPLSRSHHHHAHARRSQENAKQIVSEWLRSSSTT